MGIASKATGLILALLLLSGCAPALVGGAAVGASVVHDRRTVGTVIDDETIELSTYRALGKDAEISEYAHINATAYNGALLLTGEAPNEAARDRAERIVRGVQKVRRIYNELVVAGKTSLVSRSNDVLISTSVKGALLGVDAGEDFDATRVKVVTEAGTVFLMGLLKRSEVAPVVDTVRRQGGVKRVIKLFEYID